jgi:hypothetical protein
MIVDLYEVPTEKQLKQFLVADSNSIVSIRQKVDIALGSNTANVDNMSVAYTVYTSVTAAGPSVGPDQSLMVNYVAISNGTTVFDDLDIDLKVRKEGIRQQALCSIRAGVVDAIIHYGITVVDREADRDILVFCNGAFTGIDEPHSLPAIQAINRVLHQAEFDCAVMPYSSLRLSKDDEGNDLIPKLEAFEAFLEQQNEDKEDRQLDVSDRSSNTEPNS